MGISRKLPCQIKQKVLKQDLKTVRAFENIDAGIGSSRTRELMAKTVTEKSLLI